MKALSIKQPWLWAITDLDKRIENRTWKPPPWIYGQRVALHASKSDDRDGNYAIGQIANVEAPTVLPRGAIVATAIIDGYQTFQIDKWWAGPYGWILVDVQKLDQPIPCRGALGLWDVPQDIMEQLPSRPSNNGMHLTA